MKTLITILGLTALTIFAQDISAQTKVSPQPNKLAPPPPPPCDNCGGGGGGLPPVEGAIEYEPYTFSARDANTPASSIAGAWDTYENNGATHNIDQVVSGDEFTLNETRSYACKNYSGQNDQARSAEFWGNIAGRTFEFYDSPSGDKSDDWTSITFKQNPPAGGYRYIIYTFEASYSDDYVTVTYHPYNGLDGKVSYVLTYPGSN